MKLVDAVSGAFFIIFGILVIFLKKVNIGDDSGPPVFVARGKSAIYIGLFFIALGITILIFAE